jgi:hypothetical protein
VQNVLKIVTLYRFFAVEQLEELLNELRSDIYLERFDINRLIDD